MEQYSRIEPISIMIRPTDTTLGTGLPSKSTICMQAERAQRCSIETCSFDLINLSTHQTQSKSKKNVAPKKFPMMQMIYSKVFEPWNETRRNFFSEGEIFLE